MLKIRISDKHIKNGKLDKVALAEIKYDVVDFLTIDYSRMQSSAKKVLAELLTDAIVAFDGDKIIFKTVVEFWRCESLICLENVIFNGNVWFWHCNSLMYIEKTVFKSKFSFYNCKYFKNETFENKTEAELLLEDKYIKKGVANE